MSINERIAKVKGWVYLPETPDSVDWWMSPSRTLFAPCMLPDWENSIGEAWELVYEVHSLNPGWRFSLLGGDTTDEYTLRDGTKMGGFFGWTVEFFGHHDASQDCGQRHASERGRTASEAICLAYLAIMEQSKESSE